MKEMARRQSHNFARRQMMTWLSRDGDADVDERNTGKKKNEGGEKEEGPEKSQNPRGGPQATRFGCGPAGHVRRDYPLKDQRRQEEGKYHVELGMKPKRPRFSDI